MSVDVKGLAHIGLFVSDIETVSYTHLKVEVCPFFDLFF